MYLHWYLVCYDSVCYAVKPTMEFPKLGGIQCSDSVRHAGWFADPM